MKTLKILAFLLLMLFSLGSNAQAVHPTDPAEVYPYCRSNALFSALGGDMDDFCRCFTDQLTTIAKFYNGNLGSGDDKNLIIMGPVYYCAAKIKNMDSVAVLRAVDAYGKSRKSQPDRGQESISQSSLFTRGAPLNIRDPQSFNTFCFAMTNSMPRYAAAVQSGESEALCKCSYAKLKKSKHPVQEMDLFESLDSCLREGAEQLITR